MLAKRVSTSLLATLAVLLPALSSARPPHKRETRGEIVALEQQWCQAQLHDDVSAMDKLLSDDFVGITVAGEIVTKAQQLDRMRERKVAITALDLSDIKVKLIGQIAVVTSQAHLASSGPDSRVLNGDFRYTRVYQHLPSGAWKITSFEATRVREPIGRPAAQTPASPPPADPPPPAA
jgi:ketosteroid isomerase-like protein